MLVTPSIVSVLKKDCSQGRARRRCEDDDEGSQDQADPGPAGGGGHSAGTYNNLQAIVTCVQAPSRATAARDSLGDIARDPERRASGSRPLSERSIRSPYCRGVCSRDYGRLRAGRAGCGRRGRGCPRDPRRRQLLEHVAVGRQREDVGAEEVGRVQPQTSTMEKRPRGLGLLVHPRRCEAADTLTVAIDGEFSGAASHDDAPDRGPQLCALGIDPGGGGIRAGGQPHPEPTAPPAITRRAKDEAATRRHAGRQNRRAWHRACAVSARAARERSVPPARPQPPRLADGRRRGRPGAAFRSCHSRRCSKKEHRDAGGQGKAMSTLTSPLRVQAR